MSKVYLSSPLLDLKPERQAITDWLIAAGFQPVHSYIANSETVRDSCLNDIDGCELYILILGHRYGSQPKQDNPDRLSITHLEFRHAGEKAIPRLAFLRTSVPDINLSDLNDPARSPLVLGFRTEIADSVRAAEFKDMEELVAAFSAAILHHVMEMLKARDADAASSGQRLAELEAELEKARMGAVSRVLETASQPEAGELAKQARTALLKGDTALAEQLLRQQEDRAANEATGKHHEAAELAREIAGLSLGRNSQAALEALERAVQHEPEDYPTLSQLGDIQLVLGQSTTALSSYRSAMTLVQTRLDADPANTRWQRDLSVSHNKIGDVLVAQGKLPEALAAFQKGMGIRETLARHDPANTKWQRDLSVSHEKIGNVLVAQGKLPEALTAFQKGMGIAESLARHDPANTEWQRDLIVSNVKLSEVTGDKAYIQTALGIAEKMQADKTLAPRDAWMVEVLRKRLDGED